ncbi:hypothetical protein MtrunA17_Chr1g0179251 [Medicago truncatula]|uniref:Uncharacterized protein n=1 Tax=Medicago truncatula TaxID=3880 RepID=A0A396JQY9_MEDTR|nr:hypothetical protein MtrunA17_Chr1g0179251 [Medicago truncatula]
MILHPMNLLSCPLSKYGLKSPTWITWKHIPLDHKQLVNNYSPDEG